MPTGYTAAIADDITFHDFVMNCARAMGVCVTMRDDSVGVPIPERFEPSDYHVLKLAEANAALAKLHDMSGREVVEAAQAAFDAETKANIASIAKIRALRDKYEAMLAQVNAWTPPTPDHEEFKKFMASQIMESIPFDCNEDFYHRRQPKQMAGEEWRAAEIAKATYDVDYHTKENVKEIERAEGRNNWLASLRASLQGETHAKSL